MTRRFSSLSVALAVVLVVSGIRLGMAVPLDSNAFNHQYNGDVYPASNYVDDYVVQGNNPFASGPTSDGDILTFRNAAGGSRLISTDWSVTHATGWTVEFRLKLGTDFPDESNGAIQLGVGDTVNGDVLRIHQNQTRDQLSVVIDTQSNTDDFHTFRLALDSTNTFRVYRDGELKRTFGPGGGEISSNLLFLGSNSGSVGGPTVYLDYIRWDNTGAYEPVPEPATWMLMTTAMIGLTMLTRRKRG